MLVTYMDLPIRAVKLGGLRGWGRVQNIPGNTNSLCKGPKVRSC